MNSGEASRRPNSEARKIVFFLLVGALATAVNYSVFRIFLDLFKIHYLVSSWTGYVSGVFTGFILNSRFTFSAGKLKARQPVLYFGVYLFSLALSTGLLYLLVDTLGIPPKWANLLAIGQSTVTNYLGCRFLVFRT